MTRLVETYEHNNGSDTERVRSVHVGIGGMHRLDDFDPWAAQVWYERERVESQKYGWHTITGSVGFAFRGRSFSWTWGKA